MPWSDRDWLVRPEVKFVDSGQHLTVSLHKGKGADNRQNWYIGSPDYTHVHEVSHQMGLLDEYADVSVPEPQGLRRPLDHGRLLQRRA